MFHRILRREPSRIQVQPQEDTITLIEDYQEQDQEKEEIAVYIPEPPQIEPPKVIEEKEEENEEIDEEEKTPEELEEEIKKLNKKLKKRLSMTGYLGKIEIDETPVVVKTIEVGTPTTPSLQKNKKYTQKFKT